MRHSCIRDSQKLVLSMHLLIKYTLAHVDKLDHDHLLVVLHVKFLFNLDEVFQFGHLFHLRTAFMAVFLLFTYLKTKLINFAFLHIDQLNYTVLLQQ